MLIYRIENILLYVVAATGVSAIAGDRDRGALSINFRRPIREGHWTGTIRAPSNQRGVEKTH